MDAEKLKKHKKEFKMSNLIKNFQTLIQVLDKKVDFAAKRNREIDEDNIRIMEKQLQMENRIRKLERLAGFRTPLWKRIIGKKDHLSYLDSKNPDDAVEYNHPPQGNDDAKPTN